MPAIEMQTIPNETHRYPTVGDYYATPQGWAFRVSQMGDSRYEFLVLLHEFVEWFITQQRGISEASISAFDIEFEAEREAGLQTEEAEPGDDPRAPYRTEHQFATKLERLAAEELGVDWGAYEAAIVALFEAKPDA